MPRYQGLVASSLREVKGLVLKGCIMKWEWFMRNLNMRFKIWPRLQPCELSQKSEVVNY